MTPKPRAIAIIRVSRIKEGAQSPEVQRRLIEQFAARQDWNVIDVLNENELRGGNVSGGADLSKRPGLGPALERVIAGKAQIIVAADPSRLFRKLDIQMATIDQVEAAGGEFWTAATGRISHDTADAELLANLKGSVDHFQRRYARDKSFLAVEVAIEQGKVPWSQTAPGYVRSKNGDGKYSTLTPDPAVRPVIERAFKMRAGKFTIADVRAFLAARGIKRSYHGTMHLLRDRIYLGEIHFGTHTPNLTAHEPIIGRELFDRVQRRADSRGRKAKSDRLLARIGVLICSGCGGRMVVGTQTQNGRLYPFYRCGHVREDCDKRQNISAELVEGEVVAWIKAELRNVTETASPASTVAETLAQLEREEAALAAAWRSAKDAGLLGETGVTQDLTELREARDEARDRHDDAVDADESLSVAISANGNWDELTLDEQRDLVKATINRIRINPGRGPERIEIEAS